MEVDLTPPPSYEDVIEEDNRLKKMDKFRSHSRSSFALINVLCSALIILAMLMIRSRHIITVHMLNVTLYCKDPIYNIHPIPKQDNAYAYFLVFFIMTIILIVGMIRFKMAGLIYEIWMIKVVLEIWAFCSHLIFMFVAIELIKAATGVPYPYYFANKDLKSYYCEPSDGTIPMNNTLQLLDDSYRTSFPSYRAAIYSFCITFLYLYVDHYDILIGLHTAQQCVIFVLGTYTGHLLLRYVENGENHKSCVVVSLIMGILHALVAIRNTFGTVIYERTRISLIPFNKTYDSHLNGRSRSNMYELRTLRENETDTTVPNRPIISIRYISENANMISEQVVPNITFNE